MTRTAKQTQHLTADDAAIEAIFVLPDAAPRRPLIVGPDGSIQLVNGQRAFLLGYERAELVGRPIRS